MSKRILLLGESCLDAWVIGPCPRMSPESPVPIQTPTRTDTNLGMAANVKANLESLWPGIRVDFFHQTKQILKIRHVDEVSGQQLLRVDDGDDSFEPDYWTKVVDGMAANKDGYCALVVSDYAKGLLSEKLIEAAVEVARELGIPSFLDTKKILGGWSKNVDFVKINQKEYNAQLKAGVSEPWRYCRNLIVTRGRDGIIWYNEDGSIRHLKASVAGKLACVSGAGDTALAALVVSYLKTNVNEEKILDYMAKAAAVAVSKPGVVAVSAREVEDWT